jgi:NADPH:quinone reductase-like Zn-dependent oxidoreductase
MTLHAITATLMTLHVINRSVRNLMPSNSAAWLTAERSPLVVQPAPYTAPAADEIVIRNRAIAVNPLDSVKQTSGNLMYGWVKYPAVLGEDVAGEVVEVGSAVTRFRVGDRVLAYAVGLEKQRNSAAEGAFQLYTVALQHLASPIPESMSFDDAAVLPLGLSTAASALFQNDQLGLRHPSAAPSPVGETLLVWGGSTSVGSNAIQLAVAAGYDVISTASPKNHDYVKSLGARLVFDYRSATVVQDVASALRGRTLAGAIAVGTGSAKPTARIVAAVPGRKRVAMTSPPVSFEGLPGRRLSPRLISTMSRLVASTSALQVRCLLRGIRAKFIWGSSLMNNEVGPMIYEHFLPAALASGQIISAPRARVVGVGLEHVQTALDALRAGVSAEKLVVRL